MNGMTIAPATVVAVLLADGWHQIIPGSFSVGMLSFETGVGHGAPGFRFEQAEIGSPYGPATLTGPLDSIIAVRQVTPAARDSNRIRAAHNGQRSGYGALSPVRTDRKVALGGGNDHEHIHHGSDVGMRQPVLAEPRRLPGRRPGAVLP